MQIDPSTERFDLKIAITEEDIDQFDHVNNVVYLRWVQEVAIAHWNDAATTIQKDTIGWVVVRHEIDYRYSARMADEIIARTWVGTAKKNFFERHTDILRLSDMKLLAHARSLWCPIDLNSRRPTRAGTDIHERFSVPDSGTQAVE